MVKRKFYFISKLSNTRACLYIEQNNSVGRRGVINAGEPGRVAGLKSLKVRTEQSRVQEKSWLWIRAEREGEGHAYQY